jgi:hypothetical protein
VEDPINKRYLESDYLEHNPDWDMADSPWKAEKVVSILQSNDVNPRTFCEVGCGAGAVLGSLKGKYPKAQFSGYDIAPDAERFWDNLKSVGIDLHIGDFFLQNKKVYDVIMLLDVLEHVADPHQFLIKSKPFTEYMVVHFPLDLSAISVTREKPLLHVRRKVGHIHFFTKGIALELLTECGYEVIDWQYTHASFSSPQRSLRTKIFGFLRAFGYAIHKDFFVRLLGGETLMVLVKARSML